MTDDRRRPEHSLDRRIINEQRETIRLLEARCELLRAQLAASQVSFSSATDETWETPSLFSYT